MTALLNPPQGHEVFVARITAVKVAAAICRRALSTSLTFAQATAAIGVLRRDIQSTYRVVELSPVLADLAITMAERHQLRGYDCVQVATAVLVHRNRTSSQLSPLMIISADVNLNAAAQTEGITVDVPNHHS